MADRHAAVGCGCLLKASLALPVQILDDAEKHMVSAEQVRLPHRIIHLPMAFDEKWTHEAINRFAGFNLMRGAPGGARLSAAWYGPDVFVCDLLFSLSPLPMSACRYMRSVRPEAPYLPSNVKFIAGRCGWKQLGQRA